LGGLIMGGVLKNMGGEHPPPMGGVNNSLMLYAKVLPLQCPRSNCIVTRPYVTGYNRGCITPN